jgi:hypothetical protein
MKKNIRWWKMIVSSNSSATVAKGSSRSPMSIESKYSGDIQFFFVFGI